MIKKYILLNFDKFLFDILMMVFNAYTRELLLISLIMWVAKYSTHMSRKCILQFRNYMKLINGINEIEFAIAIKHDTLSKYYKNDKTF